MNNQLKEAQGTFKPRVCLAHGGVQYSYQLALALQELGVLEKFYTTFVYSESHWTGRALCAIPKSWAASFLPYLNRRRPIGLRPDLVHPHIWPELFQRAGSFLLGKNYFTTNRLLHWRNRAFDLYMRSQLSKVSFDVLIALSGSALYSFRTAKRLGKVAILDQHDIHYRAAERLLREELERSPAFSSTTPYWPPLKSYLRCLEEEMELADYILIPSSFALRTHLEAGVPKEKLILMPHAVERPYESLDRKRHPDGKFRVLYAGQFTQRKGIQYLLEAIKQLDLPSIELIMIGDPVGNADGLKLYRGYYRRVEYVAHKQLKEFFDMSDVLVLPSIYDAFGLVALEAMASGLPVIVSENTVAGSDVVRDGIDGFVVPIRNVDTLKDRLLRLMEEEELRVKMGGSGRERVKEFNWDSYKARFENLMGRIGEVL
jgi:starch synthase